MPAKTTLFRVALFAILQTTCHLPAATQDSIPSFWDTRRKLESQFENELSGLIKRCRSTGLESDAKTASQFLIPRDPNRQYIFIPTENQVDAERFADLEPRNKTELESLLAKHSEQLLALAKSEAESGNGAWAFQLLNEILFYSPNHREVRNILGHRIIGSDTKKWRVKSDRLRIRKASKPEKEMGWPSKSYWIASTNHFYIVSTANENQLHELAVKLERWHDVWRQVFFEYNNSQKNLRRWIAGTSKPTQSGRKFKVVFFADRNEYIATLKESIPGIEVSTGYYNDATKLSYFFASQDRSIQNTWRHELTHQMFQESRRSVLSPFRNQLLWLGEGIAMYFESLVDHEHYVTLGGFEARRLQYARLRRLKERFRIPVNQLSKLNMRQFQSLPEVAKIYSQSAGVTHFLMSAKQGQHQRALIDVLALIYQGRLKPNSFESAMSLTFDQIEKGYDKFLRVSSKEIRFFDRKSDPEELALLGVKLDEKTLEPMASLRKLDWLDLSGSDVRGERLQHLEKCKIESLLLTGSIVDAGTAKVLSRLNLVELDVSGTDFSDQELAILSESKSIRVLNLSQTKVTRQGIRRFATERPEVQLGY